MNMVYQNNNLYIDLEGDIDDELLLKKLKNIKESYNVEDIVINKENAFNYSNYKINKFRKMFRTVVVK